MRLFTMLLLVQKHAAKSALHSWYCQKARYLANKSWHTYHDKLSQRRIELTKVRSLNTGGPTLENTEKPGLFNTFYKKLCTVGTRYPSIKLEFSDVAAFRHMLVGLISDHWL